MDNEELWKRIQRALALTDKQVDMVKASPHRRKLLESGPEQVRRKIVAEVVEAQNCAAHGVGAKYVIRANGVLRVDDNSGRLCVSVLSLLYPVVDAVSNALAEGYDPKPFAERFIRCPDTGIECGGYGRVLLKVTVE